MPLFSQLLRDLIPYFFPRTAVVWSLLPCRTLCISHPTNQCHTIIFCVHPPSTMRCLATLTCLVVHFGLVFLFNNDFGAPTHTPRSCFQLAVSHTCLLQHFSMSSSHRPIRTVSVQKSVAMQCYIRFSLYIRHFRKGRQRHRKSFPSCFRPSSSANSVAPPRIRVFYLLHLLGTAPIFNNVSRTVCEWFSCS